MKLAGMAMAAAAVMMGGCLTVELEIPVVTPVAVVEGNKVLHNAGATLHGDLLEPARIDELDSLADSGFSSVNLVSFELNVTTDSVSDAKDLDDLSFVESMTIYVRSVKEGSRLPERSVGWYYEDDDTTGDSSVLIFDVDDTIELMPYMQEGFELFSKATSMVPGDDVSIEGVATFLALPERD